MSYHESSNPNPSSDYGSNDPGNPTRIDTGNIDDSEWLISSVSGSVSALDPDYFYFPIPKGAFLSSVTLQSYQSNDPIAFYALDEGATFSAGQNLSLMLVGRHFGPGDIGKNLLPEQALPLTTEVVLWVNQTGSDETFYSFLLSFEVLNGPDILGTEGPDTLIGTSAPERIYGLDGNDTISGGLRNDTIDGGDGTDVVVYRNGSENHLLSMGPSGAITVTFIGPQPLVDPPIPTEGTDLLINVERIAFADKTYAFDTEGPVSAGGIYRLYKATFNRDPDAGGLGYWIAEADAERKDAVRMAEDFVWSEEFQSLYGIRTTDNFGTGTDVEALVRGFYENVLGRSPDQEGLDFYTNVIESKERTVGRVLAEISDSQENYNATISLIANGIVFDPWLG